MNRLSFSIGETHLSPEEAARLVPGDIVLTHRDAGCPGLVLYNNLPVAVADAVVIDRTFGCRLVDTDFRPRFEVDPGRMFRLGALTPATVELASFSVPFDAVAGLPAGSILHFGLSAFESENVELVWGGAPLARGRAVVVGEKMGIRILRRLRDVAAGPGGPLSGNVADAADQARAKDYDFTRPDRFSVDQFRRLGTIHRLAQRHLEVAVPAVAAALEGHSEALFLDQCTLAEARDLLAGWGMARYQTWHHDRRRAARAEAEPVVFEVPDCPRPLGPEVRKNFFRPRPAANPPLGHEVFAHLGGPLADGDPATVARALVYGWRQTVDFALTPTDAPEDERPLDGNEMVVVVVVRRAEDQPPVLGLVYPFLTLEPYLGLLGQ